MFKCKKEWIHKYNNMTDDIDECKKLTECFDPIYVGYGN